jgi:hypothetical protein
LHTKNSSPDAGREGDPTGNGPACLGPFQALPASGSEIFPTAKDTDDRRSRRLAVLSRLRASALHALRQRFRLEDAPITRRPGRDSPKNGAGLPEKDTYLCRWLDVTSSTRS